MAWRLVASHRQWMTCVVVAQKDRSNARDTVTDQTTKRSNFKGAPVPQGLGF